MPLIRQKEKERKEIIANRLEKDLVKEQNNVSRKELKQKLRHEKLIKR